MSVNPTDIQTAIQGALVLGLGALVRSFGKNRKAGQQRDSKVDSLTKALEGVLVKLENLSNEVHKDRIATEVTGAKLHGFERELAYLRAELQSLRTSRSPYAK